MMAKWFGYQTILVMELRPLDTTTEPPAADTIVHSSPEQVVEHVTTLRRNCNEDQPHTRVVEDGNREIRCMVLLALPCIPLPLIVTKELQDESSYVDTNYHTASSHDLISHLMNLHAAVGSDETNSERAILQAAAHKQLFDSVDQWAMDQAVIEPDTVTDVPPLEKSYELLCAFARAYLGSFMKRNATPDIRFVQACDVDFSSKVRESACSFTKAQDTIFGVLHNRGTRSVDCMAYPELVQDCVRRILAAGGDGEVHILTGV